MELTPEERQRIEEEERKRLAEENYREEVRARIQRESSASQRPSVPVVPKTEKRSGSFWLIVICVLAGAVGTVLITNLFEAKTGADSAGNPHRTTMKSPPPSIRYVPVNQKIATGQLIVKSGGYVQYRIRINPEMRDARISGSFNVGGGSGNDIEAVLAGENEFPNWINGHEARVYYGTGGKKTTDRFSVRLGPGDYILAFSNKFSVLSDKQVFLNVDLNYSRLETY